MRILVFGASGQTGSEIVKQGLEQGHSITAFVRSPSKLQTESPLLSVLQGDVADSSAVTAAVTGHDAVVSALGVSIPMKHDPAVITGVNHIITAMQATGRLSAHPN